MPFINRDQAGRLLGDQVSEIALVEPVVLALPRGGVPVGFRVAEALAAPLDVIVVRKLGVPFQSELAMGAVGEDGVRVLDEEVVLAAGVDDEEIRSVEIRERAELERRASRYRSGRPRVALPGRTAVVVDDGMATGSSARAACLVARAHGALEVVIAVPVASRQAVEQLQEVADDVVVVEVPEPFFAVGQWYFRFDQTSDHDVVKLLDDARRWQAMSGADPPQPTKTPDRPAKPGAGARAASPPEQDPFSEDVAVELERVELGGCLTVPVDPYGAVLFAHGSGSGRHSPRNRYVADVLNHAGLATLLFDLLTADEERWRPNVFDIALLGSRLTGATEWLQHRPELHDLPLGYFGASTGSAAALWAAAQDDAPVGAVVSRGGRPDLARRALPAVTAPTLLVVGAEDKEVLERNRTAQSLMTCENRLVVVPGATHLFTEAGTLETVARLAENWFDEHLAAPASGLGHG